MDDYGEYKELSLKLKLKKIELLNEYYKKTYNNKKLEVYIDFDGVILDTMRKAANLLFENYNIKLQTSSRDNIIEQQIISNFFKNLDWNYLLSETEEINESIKFIKLINSSNIYEPIIYSAVNSTSEAYKKHLFIKERLNGVKHQFIMAHTPKTCDNKSSVLIDDDNFNLVNWTGYPIHFDSSIESPFPNIDDLGELYYLFYPINNVFYIKDSLYKNCVKKYGKR